MCAVPGYQHNLISDLLTWMCRTSLHSSPKGLQGWVHVTGLNPLPLQPCPGVIYIPDQTTLWLMTEPVVSSSIYGDFTQKAPSVSHQHYLRLYATGLQQPVGECVRLSHALIKYTTLCSGSSLLCVCVCDYNIALSSLFHSNQFPRKAFSEGSASNAVKALW